MLELWGGYGGIAAMVAVGEMVVLALLLHRRGRPAGSSLVSGATRLGARARAAHR